MLSDSMRNMIGIFIFVLIGLWILSIVVSSKLDSNKMKKIRGSEFYQKLMNNFESLNKDDIEWIEVNCEQTQIITNSGTDTQEHLFNYNQAGFKNLYGQTIRPEYFGEQCEVHDKLKLLSRSIFKDLNIDNMEYDIRYTRVNHSNNEVVLESTAELRKKNNQRLYKESI